MAYVWILWLVGMAFASFWIGYFWGLVDGGREAIHLVQTYRLALGECNEAVRLLQKGGSRFTEILAHPAEL